MRYVGGKSKLASKIASSILNELDDETIYLEPFLGGGAVFKEMAPYFERIAAADIHKDLMMMWKELQNGWKPRTTCEEFEYDYLKTQPSSAWRGLVGFGQSFGGKWFGGYARGKTSDGRDRNYLDETVRNLEKIVPLLEGVRLSDRPYDYWNPTDNCVAYCDPPYADTQDYKEASGFDTDKFWSVMDQWHDKGAIIFVSEYKAPSHWKVLAEFDHRQTLSHHDNRTQTTEKLWTR